MTTLTETELTLTDAEFEAFQLLVQGHVPGDFRTFIMTYNGGMPDSTQYISEAGDEYSVHQFYSVTHGELTIESMLIDFSLEGRSSDLMPFANDSGANHYCLDIGSSKQGQIFKVYIDGSEPAPVYIAPSFKKFFDGLQTPETDQYLI
ncbi:MAG: SMI1/KNR4 family protein [Planctomycetota bacterium]